MNSPDDKLLYQIALTKIPGVGDIIARNLIKIVGEPQAIFKSSGKALAAIRGLSANVVHAIHKPEVMRQAEDELSFVRKHNIHTCFTTEEKYPQRLLDCVDSPILIYCKGDIDFNKQKVISIVGTRNATHYGSNFCESFLKELSKDFPDLVVVSGLAYGIDICAHRAALANGLPTVAVLAHGLDRIYPAVHKQTAIEMLHNGGLLTEFPSQTEPDRFNFVRRNRIVAGMADAVLVMESAPKGGSLITAEIANSYCRDVFALPGRVSDAKSEGCNKLINDHKAEILISAKQFVRQMNWDLKEHGATKPAKQQRLFFDLTPEETTVLEKLSKEGAKHIDQLSKELNIPAFELFAVLLELEMKGAVNSLAGNIFEAC